MLTSKETTTLKHPHEDTQFAIRKLSFGMLEEAADAKRDKLLAVMRSLEGITLPTSTPDAEAQADDPAVKYDRATVIWRGLVEWTYDAPLTDYEQLDEDSAAWLFAEIIKFSMRSAAEGEASGSGSTASMA